MRARRHILSTAFVLISSTAQADDACLDSKTPASCYFDAGWTELRATPPNPREAAKKFLASYRIDPKLDPLAMYGTALARDDQYVAAAEVLEKTLEGFAELETKVRRDRGSAAPAEAAKLGKMLDEIAKHVEVVKTTFASISPRIAHVTVRLPAEHPPRVMRKGAGELRSSDPTRLAIAAGGDTLVFTYADGHTRELAVTVAAGNSDTVEPPPPEVKEPIVTKPVEQEPPVVAAQPAAASSPPWAYIVGGAGIGAVAIGLGFGLRARSQWSDAHDSHCNSQDLCDHAGFELANGAHTSAAISTVFVGVGLVGLGAGAYLWYRARHAHAEGQTAMIVPMIGDHAIGAFLSGAL